MFKFAYQYKYDVSFPKNLIARQMKNHFTTALNIYPIICVLGLHHYCVLPYRHFFLLVSFNDGKNRILNWNWFKEQIRFPILLRKCKTIYVQIHTYLQNWRTIRNNYKLLICTTYTLNNNFKFKKKRELKCQRIHSEATVQYKIILSNHNIFRFYLRGFGSLDRYGRW